MRALAVALVVAGLAGCGDDEAREPAGEAARPGAPSGPRAVTCRQVQTRREALLLAREVDHRVVAPPGYSRRETDDVIAGSLFATCRQPKLPGVADPLDYRPVGPVLREVQKHFDQEALEGH